MTCCCPYSTKTIFVNSQNVNHCRNGKSWKTAFITLQEALDLAALNCHPTKILVAKGTYFPSKLYSPSGIPGGASGITTINLCTFNIPNNVSIYGGFEGCEPTHKERNIKKNKTILSGSYVNWHVVTLGNDITQTGVNAKLIDLVIAYGNASSPAPVDTITQPFKFAHSYGGGLYVTFGSNIVIKNVYFKNNTGLGIGGAAFSINSNIDIDNCLFKNNSTTGQAGALGIYNTYEGNTPHFGNVNRCLFKNNTTMNFGGAIVVEGTLPNINTKTIITNSVFKKNFAQEGGAIVVDSETAEINDCEFYKNTSSVNAGAVSTTNIVNTIASAFQRPPVPLITFQTTINNCKFENNTAFGNINYHDTLLGGPTAGIDFPLGGGAVVTYLNGLNYIDKTCFINNKSENSDGGAFLNGRAAASSPLGIQGLVAFDVDSKVFNSEFIENFALRGSGGAIASEPSTYPFIPPLNIPISATQLTVKNTKFIKNKSTFAGGAIYINDSLAYLKNNCYKDNRGHPCNDVFISEK